MEGTEGEGRRKGKEHFWTRELRAQRCSGLAVDVKDGMLAFMNFRTVWR